MPFITPPGLSRRQFWNVGGALALAGTVALLHSARAARRLAALVDGRRSAISLAALSPAVAAAAGAGWGHVAAADAPSDAALVALAATLAH